MTVLGVLFKRAGACAHCPDLNQKNRSLRPPAGRRLAALRLTRASPTAPCSPTLRPPWPSATAWPASRRARLPPGATKRVFAGRHADGGRTTRWPTSRVQPGQRTRPKPRRPLPLPLAAGQPSPALRRAAQTSPRDALPAKHPLQRRGGPPPSSARQDPPPARPAFRSAPVARDRGRRASAASSVAAAAGRDQARSSKRVPPARTIPCSGAKSGLRQPAPFAPAPGSVPALHGHRHRQPAGTVPPPPRRSGRGSPRGSAFCRRSAWRSRSVCGAIGKACQTAIHFRPRNCASSKSARSSGRKTANSVAIIPDSQASEKPSSRKYGRYSPAR